MVEPDRNNHPNLQQQLKKYLKSCLRGEDVYAQHIHRLDRPVSGVILFAKQKSVLHNLSNQFAERRVKKYYDALTDKAPLQKEGTLTGWFRKEKKKAVVYDEQIPFSETVKLNFAVKEFLDQRFCWDIELLTGKYHQIRAQLAKEGCPIIGDQVYGSTVTCKENTIALHARKLIFRHPVTNLEMIMESDNDFKVAK